MPSWSPVIVFCKNERGLLAIHSSKAAASFLLFLFSVERNPPPPFFFCTLLSQLLQVVIASFFFFFLFPRSLFGWHYAGYKVVERCVSKEERLCNLVLWRCVDSPTDPRGSPSSLSPECSFFFFFSFFSFYHRLFFSPFGQSLAHFWSLTFSYLLVVADWTSLQTTWTLMHFCLVWACCAESG